MANTYLCPHCLTIWKTKRPWNESRECKNCLEDVVIRPHLGDKASFFRSLDLYSIFKNKCPYCSKRNTKSLGDTDDGAEWVAGEMRRWVQAFYWCNDCSISWHEGRDTRA
jgi:hypothetical protein